MKKILDYLDALNKRIEEWCENLSPQQRKKAILIALGLYVLLGIITVASEWSEFTKQDKNMEIRHIQIPAIKKMNIPKADSVQKFNNNQ
ncbi:MULTISPECIES: TraL conjugative transposon family protein [unclassified Flavobacterium]|uniref:TraL conjugative transposon family protein n=1 Tax=unclassified Flavobacterium TaxID=196869 RepID=UPI0025C36C1E|nr:MULTISPECIES: TraL conjugative transposon family protein [unclassified Flavobacterium]MBA4153702.1 hypothetical protein [Flavobacterium sp.]MDP2159888.1 TraL conjugative transposon family protein [Flavobacterium sp.]